MKAKVKLLNQKLPEITGEINKLLKEKFNLTGLNVSEIHFAKDAECPPGFVKRCQFFGNDPITGKPIIKCQCVSANDI